MKTKLVDTHSFLDRIPKAYLWVIIGGLSLVLMILVVHCVLCCKRRLILRRKAKEREKLAHNNTYNKDGSMSSSPEMKKKKLKRPQFLKLAANEAATTDEIEPMLPTSPNSLKEHFGAMFQTKEQEVQPANGGVPPFTSFYLRATGAIPATIPEAPSRDSQYFGVIFFSVSYDVFAGDLKVVIEKALNLPVKDLLNGASDPYVQLYLSPGKKQRLKTKTKKKCLNPIWNEPFIFPGLSHAEVKEKTLYLEVFDFDRFSRNDILGCTQLSLYSLALQKDPLQFEKKLHASKNARGYLGDLLISMCYNLSSARITIVVMKCNRLKPMDVATGKADPYVKVCMLHSGTRIIKKKTTTKRRNTNPVWNETMEFDAPVEKIRGITFEFTVMDFDVLLKNKYIGQVLIGYSTTGSSLKHWTDMLTNPNKPIANWHRIYKY